MSAINIPKDILKTKKKEKKNIIPKNMLFSNNNEIPDRIVIYLNSKLNIEQINKVIIYKFNKSKDDIKNKYNYIVYLKNKLKNVFLKAETKELLHKIEKEENEIKEIENDIHLNAYKDEAKYILEKLPDVNYNDKLLYLEIAKKYINIEIIKNLENDIKCNGCGTSLKDNEENLDGFYICHNCNCINNCIKPLKYVKDSENYLTNSTDEDINNFIKVLSKFEGKNVSYIPEILYQELDEYFIKKNHQKGEYYKNLPLNKEGKKEGTNKKLLWSALEDLNYNQYYDEINYIIHVYWGWKLPDLSLYKEQIIKDYQLTQQVWYKIKKDYKRSASLGTSFRLYSHLKSVNFPNCKKEDFKIQDMVDSLRLHNDAWERMCKLTGIKYYPVN